MPFLLVSSATGLRNFGHVVRKNTLIEWIFKVHLTRDPDPDLFMWTMAVIVTVSNRWRMLM